MKFTQSLIKGAFVKTEKILLARSEDYNQGLSGYQQEVSWSITDYNCSLWSLNWCSNLNEKQCKFIEKFSFMHYTILNKWIGADPPGLT